MESHGVWPFSRAETPPEAESSIWNQKSIILLFRQRAVCGRIRQQLKLYLDKMLSEANKLLRCLFSECIQMYKCLKDDAGLIFMNNGRPKMCYWVVSKAKVSVAAEVAKREVEVSEAQGRFYVCTLTSTVAWPSCDHLPTQSSGYVTPECTIKSRMRLNPLNTIELFLKIWIEEK